MHSCQTRDAPRHSVPRCERELIQSRFGQSKRTARTVVPRWESIGFGWRDPRDSLRVALGKKIFGDLISGLVLLWRKLGGPVTSWLDTLRTASGAYLTLFLLSHLSAVFRARYLRHTDTNWIWLTSDNLLMDDWSARLAPYYFLGIVAFGLHVGCALHRVLLGHEVKEALADRAFSIIAWATGAGAVIIMTGLIIASMKN
jgi:hypothetical protein